MIKFNLTSVNKFPPIIFIMGPTSCGKTDLAIKLRQRLAVEIISVDSALIYRDMNIGTSKPNTRELTLFPHRLVNIRDPSELYSVANFYNDALHEISDIRSSLRVPLLVGGTMFYFKTLLQGLSPLPSANDAIRTYIKEQANSFGWNVLYKMLQKVDPVTADNLHPNDKMRILRALEVFLISGKTFTELIKIPGKSLPYTVYQFIILPSNRVLLHQRILARFYNMLADGFEYEVRNLYSRSDLKQDMQSMRIIGYHQMWSFIDCKIKYEEMIFRTICATKQLAKRQMTWLRKWNNAYFFTDDNLEQLVQVISQIVNHWRN